MYKRQEKYVELCHPKYGLDALPAILTFTKDVVQYVPEVDMTVVDNGTPKEELAACEALCKQTGAHFRVPVSYTHLDVYKRQGKSPSKGRSSPLAPVTVPFPNRCRYSANSKHPGSPAP